MGKLKYLILHCTASAEGKELTKEDILRMHTAPKHLGGRGWRRPGYADMIYLDGSLYNILPYDTDDKVDSWEITNGAKGLNGMSRHVVYVGGMDIAAKKAKDTRTKEQTNTLETYVKFTVLRHPNIEVLGHCDAPGVNKACPCFDVAKWLEEIGIPEKNIYRSNVK